jgi:hypothetical protein
MKDFTAKNQLLRLLPPSYPDSARRPVMVGLKERTGISEITRSELAATAAHLKQ